MDPTERRGGGRFLRLWFSCAGTYARATIDPSGASYVGRCPKCSKSITFPIGPGGTSQRVFEVTCLSEGAPVRVGR